jgi:hypothetical protein
LDDGAPRRRRHPRTYARTRAGKFVVLLNIGASNPRRIIRRRPRHLRIVPSAKPSCEKLPSARITNLSLSLSLSLSVSRAIPVNCRLGFSIPGCGLDAAERTAIDHSSRARDIDDDLGYLRYTVCAPFNGKHTRIIVLRKNTSRSGQPSALSQLIISCDSSLRFLRKIFIAAHFLPPPADRTIPKDFLAGCLIP